MTLLHPFVLSQPKDGPSMVRQAHHERNQTPFVLSLSKDDYRKAA